MAEKVLSKEEFVKLAESDSQDARDTAWCDIERTTEDYNLRVWKLDYMVNGRRALANERAGAQKAREIERIKL